MKKYKLIKEYPGSPPLGTIAEPSGDVKYIYPNVKYIYPNNEVYFESSSKKSLFKKLIENHPEFWEEVVEKDYKILKLSLAKSIKHEIRDVEDYSENYIKGLLTCKGNYIHSVKRLSDGKIFTVGDDFIYNLTSYKIKDRTNWKIIEILLIEGEVKFSYKSKDIYTISMNLVTKPEKPLFTTEDGVDIFKDNHPALYYVSLYDYYIGIDAPNTLHYPDINNFKYFSTKEAAEEYVLMNKPCLSVQDVLVNYCWCGADFKKSLKDFKIELKELVKSRL